MASVKSDQSARNIQFAERIMDVSSYLPDGGVRTHQADFTGRSFAAHRAKAL